MTETAFAIETYGLSKSFDKVVAVEAMDLTVRAGTITALLPAAMAPGKSTTLAMLFGASDLPQAGRINVKLGCMPVC